MSYAVTETHHAPSATATLLPSEAQTVILAQQGDESACEELAMLCRRQAYLFALQLTRNPDDALDVAQDAMLRFFRSLGRFDASRPVRPWLLRIVRNLVRDRARRRRIRRTESLEPAGEVLRFEPRDTAPSPESRAARRELQTLVWKCLRELPTRFREVLVLRDYQDLAYSEIAVALKIPRGTVMSRLHRARRRLQEVVQQHLRVAGG
ncbi:MAG: RNA polymerase sigma factor [Thermoanaerobaculales bacterium]